MAVKGLPIVPGQFWLKAVVRDMDGRLQGRTSHALIHAPSILHAANAPIVDIVRERMEQGLLEGTFTIEMDIRPVCGEGADHAAS